MARTIIDHLIAQLDAAFERSEAHSLLGNLRDIDDTGWHWVPSGGERSIAGVIWHAACAKYLHHSHTFGDGSVTWEHPQCARAHVEGMATAMPWVREGQRRFVKAVIALPDDSALSQVRPTHWGGTRSVQATIESVILHDAYHAGEINHIRALMQGDDRWGN